MRLQVFVEGGKSERPIVATPKLFSAHGEACLELHSRIADRQRCHTRHERFKKSHVADKICGQLGLALVARRLNAFYWTASAWAFTLLVTRSLPMRLSDISCLSIIASLGIFGCSGSGSALIQPGQYGAGSSQAGGDSNAGGAGVLGGNNPGGGADPGGGNNPGGGADPGGGNNPGGGAGPTGGAYTNGGNPPQGGNPTTGSKQATGGSIAAGGKSSGAGGIVATGGGGNPTGGASVGAGGVSVTTGGKAATGGAVSTGGSINTCVDTPRSSESCSDAKTWGFCGQSWFGTYCQVTCGTCGSGAGGNGSTGGAPTNGGNAPTGGNGPTGGNVPTGGSVSNTSNPPITGDPGWASRYWDCCMPSCAWSTNLAWCDKNGTTTHSGSNGAKSGCESGGNAFECYNFAPWYDSSTNMSYGFVAHNQVTCGTCYEIQFTGEGHDGANPGATAINGKQMIVQVINIGGIGSDQFDLMIPGGGVGAMTAGCSAQWGNVDLGATYGGLYSNTGGNCSTMKTKCQSVFGSMPDLLAGCLWFTDWYACADNPKLIYKKVNCPSQITSKSGISA